MYIRRFFAEKHTTACAFLALAATAAADIVIEQKMEGPDLNGIVTMSIKGEKMRTDVGVGKDTTGIIDLSSRKIVMLMHAQKMRTEMKLPDASELKAPDGTPLPPVKPKITHTGKKEKVNDHDCEIVTMELAGIKLTMWVDKNYPNYEKLKKDLEVIDRAYLYGVSSMDVGGIVIKTEGDVQGTKATTTLVSIKETMLKDEIFQIPADYATRPFFPGQ